MSLQDWQNNGWLRPHKTDREEIANLLAIVERDMTERHPWRFRMTGNLESHTMRL